MLIYLAARYSQLPPKLKNIGLRETSALFIWKLKMNNPTPPPKHPRTLMYTGVQARFSTKR